MKKLTALLLALVMATALCVPALAADATTGDNSIKLTDGAAGSEALGSGKQAATTNSNDNTTKITGTIKATQLKVTVPTVVAFDIDPTIEATAVDSQITAQSDKITITNGSIVPIWVRVSNVTVAMDTADSGVSNGNVPKLVNEWPSSETVGDVRTLMFAIRTETDKPAGFATKDSAAWLVGKDANGVGEPATTYYVDATNQGKLGQAGTADSGDAVTMKIYGRTGKNWMAGEKFTITPTFTVSVKPYST